MAPEKITANMVNGLFELLASIENAKDMELLFADLCTKNEIEKVLHYPLLHFGGSDSHGLLSISNKRQIGNYGIDYKDYIKVKELICHDVHD